MVEVVHERLTLASEVVDDDDVAAVESLAFENERYCCGFNTGRMTLGFVSRDKELRVVITTFRSMVGKTSNF